MKSITRIYPHKTALTLSVLMAISSLIFVMPMFAVMSFVPATDGNGNPVEFGFPAGFILAMPFIYLIFGYVSMVIGSWLYNLVAKFTGGICVNVIGSDDS